MKKIDIREAASRAAANPQAASSRFSAIGNTLERRPTAFSGAQESPSAPVAVASAPVSPAPAAEPQHQGATEGQGGQFQIVPLSQIDENTYNARHIYLPEIVRSMAATLKEDGQLVPGIAVRRGDRFMLIAGHYRKKGLEALGVKEMRLMVYDQLSARQIYVMSYRENDHKTDQTALDNALAWQRLIDDGVYPNDEAIAVDVGLSKPTVFKTLSVLKLDALVLNVVRQGPKRFALTTLYELLMLQKAGGPAVAAELAQDVLDNGVGRDQVIAKRHEIEMRNRAESDDPDDQVKPAARNSRRARLYPVWSMDKKREVANIREWDSGRLVFETTISDPDQRMKIVEALKSISNSVPDSDTGSEN